VFEEFADGKRVTKAGNFPRIPYAEAIAKYGSDKPDLRNPLVLADVSEHFRGGGFALFAKILDKAGHTVWAVPAPGGGSRAFCDKMNSWAQSEGQPGLGYIFWREGEEGGAGPIAKNIGADKANAVRDQLGLKVGDAAFFVAGDPKVFYKFAGLARNKIADELNLADKEQFAFCWVVDFPMYEWSEEDKKIDFSHNPFSMPNYDHAAFLKLDPGDRETIESITAFQYDIVCNGVELSSGAIRNHKPDIMIKAFEITGYGRDVVEEKFGGMLNAFRYGAPPHGGSAPGVDRIVMLLAGVDNLREVIVFPFNQQAQDLMMSAPGEVTGKQLRELHIRVVEPPKS
jgi:aspartyl-tRNA synthetase